MKVQIEKSVILTAVRTAIRAVAAKSVIPAMEGLLLEVKGNDMVVTGFNGSLAMQTKVDVIGDEDGAVVLDARLLSNIISKMDDNDVFIRTTDKTAVIDCGDSHFELAYIDPSTFPELPEIDVLEQISIPQNKLKSMLTDVLYAASQDETRMIHTGPMFDFSGDMLTMVALDGFRLALRKEQIEGCNSQVQFVPPASAMNEVVKLCDDTDDTMVVSVGTNHALFSIGNTILICRRLSGSFFDYEKAVADATKAKMKVKAAKKALMDTIDRVSIVIANGIKSPVVCEFSTDKVLMRCVTALGAAKDVAKIDGAVEDMLEIGFNSRYLMEAVKNAPDDEFIMYMNTPIQPLFIKPVDGSDKFTYMVLPVRVRNDVDTAR